MAVDLKKLYLLVDNPDHPEKDSVYITSDDNM
jgi:hypothetical protein